MDFSKKTTDEIQFWVLNIASFVAQLTIAMINLALVYHLRRVFHLGADRIGIAASINPAIYLVFCLVGSKYTVHFRPRHLVETSLVGMGVSIAILATTAHIGVAYAALGLYGASMSLLWPQIEGWFSRGKEGKQLSRTANAFNFSWSFGAGLSSYLAGILIERSTTLPFTVGLFLFAFVFLLIYLSSLLVPGIRAVQSEHQENKENGKIDESTPLRFYSWVGIIILYTGMSIVITIFPLYAQDKLGITESQTGLLLLIRGVVTCISFLVLGKMHFWHFKLRYIFLSQALFGLSCLLAIRIATPAPYALFFFMFGALLALAYDQSMFHGASGSVNRSFRMIIHEVLLTIGAILGAVGGGFIYEQYSYGAVLSVVGLATLVTVTVEMIVAVLLWAKRKRGITI